MTPKQIKAKPAGRRRYAAARALIVASGLNPARYYNRLNTAWEERRDGVRFKVAFFWGDPTEAKKNRAVQRKLRALADRSSAACSFGTNYWFYFKNPRRAR